MSDVARYYHTSLYAFNQQARSAVIGTFNEVLQDVAVRCWYDGAQETFLLECPTSLGPVADDALTTILMKYIENELDDAENGERDPNILRFPESKFDALDAFMETQKEPAEEGDDLMTAAPLVNGKPSVTHLVIVGAAEGKVLRFFRLDELPGDRLERTLAPFNERAQRVINDGLTCRAVRWIEEQGRHVFNGRTGHGPGRTAIETMVMGELDLPRFETLHDTRTLDSDSDQTSPVRTWVHVGEAPTVEKWVRGIGETRQIDPTEKAEMPKDARNLIAATNAYAIGRVRVPKGAQMLNEESGSETSEDERPSADAFNNLLNGQGGSVNGSDDDSDSDEAENTSEPAFVDLLGPKSSKQAAMSKKKSVIGDWDLLKDSVNARTQSRPAVTPPVRPDSSQRQTSTTQQPENFPPVGSNLPSRRQTPVPVKQPPTEQSNQSQPLIRQRAVTKTSQDSAIRERTLSLKGDWCFPSYGKEFAGVDDQGLHAPAAAEARWQNENYEATKPKPKSKAVGLRQRVFSNGFSPVPTDHSASGQEGSQTGMRGSSTETLVNPPDKADAAWVNTIVQPRVRMGALVDVTSRSSDRLPDALPGFHAPKTARTKREQAAGANDAEPSNSHLVDVVENVLEDFSGQPPVNTPANMQPLVPTPAASTHPTRRNKTDNDRRDDVIVERVQSLPANYTTKRNTMRQKASKKNKAKGLKIGGRSKKVELPLPSPPPPPKPKPAVEPQLTERKPRTRETARPSKGVGDPPQMPTPQPVSSLTSDAHPFGQALLDLRNVTSLSRGTELETNAVAPQPARPVKLACQVGIILLRGLDKSLSKQTIESEVLQHKLNSTSADCKRDLFSRVTTCSTDAKALIGLMSKGDGDLITEVLYEVIIRDDTGAYLTISIPAGDKNNYGIKSQDQVLTEACAHFPTRVWDARYALLQPGSEIDTPASKAVKEFVASMQSDDEAPSFVAAVAIGVFTLERVLAKRVISQTTDKITSKVVQVQDLLMQPVDLMHHNIRAIALSEELMIQEQRLWWEVSWETSDSSEKLQSRVNEVVCGMDKIGVENQGPWVRVVESDDEKRPAVSADAILW